MPMADPLSLVDRFMNIVDRYLADAVGRRDQRKARGTDYIAGDGGYSSSGGFDTSGDSGSDCGAGAGGDCGGDGGGGD
jgi:hypothetical protein